MKNIFRTRIGGVIVSLAFVLSIYAATSTTAQGQYRRDRDERDAQSQRRDRNRVDNEIRNRIWRRQAEQSRVRNNDRYDRNNGRYERGRVYGNNGNYEVYGNNGGYGGYNNSSQVAVNQGYQAGLNTGASDAQRRQSFNPQRSHYYKNASSQAFRQGFLRGYDQGYQQYSGYGNRGYDNGNQRGGSILDIFRRP